MLQDYQIKILMLMHDLEKTMGETYEVFSDKYPEHDNLWKKLINDEKAHAEAIRRLYKLIYEGHALFDEGTIKTYAVQSVLDYVKGVHDDAISGKYTAQQALALTYDIEKSLLEKDIFKHFDVAPEFAEVLKVLDNGTQTHINISKRELDRVKV
jgi:hypothetical protein